MQEFNRTIRAMQAVLEEVAGTCHRTQMRRVPSWHRVFCSASTGDQTCRGLLIAAQRAVIDRSGFIEVVPRNEA
jgi:hypothetical protein